MSTNSYVYREIEGRAPDAPVLFLFHGTGGDEHQFIDLGKALLPEARLVSPRGDVDEAGALRFFRRTGEGRYDMADLAVRVKAMAAFVAAQAGTAAQTIGLGYSNGANILAATGVADPSLFDAQVLLHPLIPFDPGAVPGLAGRRVLITAGRRDPICPADRTEALLAWYRTQGADVAIHWHDGGHEIRQDELNAVAAFLAPYR